MKLVDFDFSQCSIVYILSIKSKQLSEFLSRYEDIDINWAIDDDEVYFYGDVEWVLGNTLNELYDHVVRYIIYHFLFSKEIFIDMNSNFSMQKYDEMIMDIKNELFNHREKYEKTITEVTFENINCEFNKYWKEYSKFILSANNIEEYKKFIMKKINISYEEINEDMIYEHIDSLRMDHCTTYNLEKNSVEEKSESLINYN